MNREQSIGLTVFTDTGHTYTFRNVEIRTDNENALEFGYKAQSDNRMKVARFSKFRIIGFSTFEF